MNPLTRVEESPIPGTTTVILIAPDDTHRKDVTDEGDVYDDPDLVRAYHNGDWEFVVIRLAIVVDDISIGTASMGAVEHGDMAGHNVDARDHPAIPDLIAEAVADARATRGAIE